MALKPFGYVRCYFGIGESVFQRGPFDRLSASVFPTTEVYSRAQVAEAIQRERRACAELAGEGGREAILARTASPFTEPDRSQDPAGPRPEGS